MKETARRYYSSLVLLAVFLPMLLLASFHVHPEAQIEGDYCKECVHHLPHAGHFSSQTFCSFDCVLCQFLTLPFLLAPAVVFTAKKLRYAAPLFQTEQGVLAGVRGAVLGRAPPVFCSFTGEN